MNYRGRSAETLRLLKDAQTDEEKTRRIQTNDLMEDVVRRGFDNRDNDHTDRTVLIICAAISAVLLLFDVIVSCSVDTGHQIGEMNVRGVIDSQTND